MATTFDLGPVERIPPGEGRTFDVDGRRVAVFRTRADTVYATQALCPHKQGPLADGLLGERRLVCPLHGFKFDLATGEAVDHACGGLETYPVTVADDGHLHLRVAGAVESGRFETGSVERDEARG
jgi:nitrite reductase (NADH) small subunit